MCEKMCVHLYVSHVTMENIHVCTWYIHVCKCKCVSMDMRSCCSDFTRNTCRGLQVRDSAGRKMSKSLGNVIDPMHVIHGISKEEMIDNLSRSFLHPAELER